MAGQRARPLIVDGNRGRRNATVPAPIAASHGRLLAVRQLLVQVPAGRGHEVVRISQQHGATNAATFPAQDGEGPIDVAMVHVPTRALGDLLDDLHGFPEMRAAFSPENTLALHPPWEDADQQAIEPGNRAPLEVLLDSLSSISSLRGFLAYTLLAAVLVWVGLTTNTEYLLVAAMLIAPFAGPAVNGALGAAHGDRGLLVHGVGRFVAGIVVMVAATAVFTLLAGQQVETPLMVDVTRVPLVAVLLPLAGGTAAALHLVLSQRASLVTGAAVGTLVAAALAPSAGVAGMALALGHWAMAGDALFELALQLAGILLSAAALFRLSGAVSPSAARALQGRRGVFPVTIGLAALATAALVGVQLTTPGLTHERDEQRARAIVQQVVADNPRASYVASDVRFTAHGPGGRRTLLGDVYASGNAEPDALAADIEQAITDAPLAVHPLMDVSVLPDR